MNLLLWITAFVLWPNYVWGSIPLDQINKELANTGSPVYHIPPGELEPILEGFKQYTLFILITTADPKYNCALCEQFDPIYKHYIEDIFEHFPQLSNEVAFMRVEASEHLDFLKSLGISSIPALWGFPTSLEVYGRLALGDLQLIVDQYQAALANGEEYDIDSKLREYNELLEYDQLGREHFVFELNMGEPMNEMLTRLAGFMSRTIKMDISPALGPKNSSSSGLDYTNFLQGFIVIFVGIKLFQKLFKTKDGEGTPFWQQRNLYAYISIVSIYLCISGMSFCVQRQSPFIAQSKGEIVWIAASSRQQMGFESILSIGFQLMFTFSLIALIDGVKIFSSADGSRDFMGLVIALIILVIYLGFTTVYQYKDPNYPFTLQKYLL